MPTRYPCIVFSPDGGSTFVVHLDALRTTPSFATPRPATAADGRLAAPWRWGGHQVDLDARVVHFTFVNRLTQAHWTATVQFE